MRATVDIAEHLLVEAKKLAAQRRLPLTRLFEESLREYLAAQRLHRVEAPPPLPRSKEAAPVAGIDLDDTSRLWETNERRRHLERYATWTPADRATFEESLRAQRRIEDLRPAR